MKHQAPVAQWIERLFPKQKVVGSTPTWRVSNFCAPASSSMGRLLLGPVLFYISEKQNHQVFFYINISNINFNINKITHQNI